jgi:GNAT superfamily N-acetyltransferase
MKTIQSTIFAILMISAVMPAWGMDYVSALTNLTASLLPLAAPIFMFNQRPQQPIQGELVPFEAKHDKEVRTIFWKCFERIPDAYYDYHHPASIDKQIQVRMWKERDHIKGVFILEKMSPTKHHIDYFAVDPQVQRTGVGTKMLHALEKELTTQSSGTLALRSSPIALEFYENNGFKCDQYRYCTKEFASTMHELKKENGI